MSGTAWHSGGGVRIAETALWTGAVALVLSVHLGVAAWLMREQPVVAADDAPPAAIMIDLAPEPEAVETEETEISEQMQEAEESAPTEESPPEEVVELKPEPLPVPEPEPEPEPVEEPEPTETVALPPDAAVPLPTPRPNPPEPKRELAKKPEPRKKTVEKAQKPRPQRQQAASQAARKAQVQTRQSNRNAARQTSSGVSKAQQARWQSRLMAHLERRKRYPADARRRREQGTVYVQFRIDDNGNVRSASIARSSGYPALDQAVVALVRRASPVPKPPPGVNKTITAPVRFNVR
ncbi:energy transducer TonB [Nitratireductor pacificus]|uniref:Protein TonB n=1 Tax=Nitratireductor pacificus pht-3B TaxID=391937 RepID=K2MM69_9HYPH|nr:energy transducer TonB [Nitratireductor pacificus]EKF18327.1 tonB protein [Nitratireductor pacificus pht-3B]